MTISDTAALSSWRNTDTKRAIVAFVEAARAEGEPGYIPPSERIAVVDNDGTLWTEKPMPIQLDLIMRGFAEATQCDRQLQGGSRSRPHEHDCAWRGRAMVKHYEGDDRDLKLLSAGLSKILVGVEVVRPNGE